MKLKGHLAFIIVVSFLVLAVVHTSVFLRTATSPASPLQLDITPGKGAWEICKDLESLDIITHAPTFLALVVLTGKASHLQAGTYVFEGSHFPQDIAEILFKGRTLRFRVTIPEGADLFDIATIIAATGEVNPAAFLTTARSPATVAFFELEAPSMEGFLYPDTYFLAPHMTPLEIIARMVDRFHQIYTPELQQQALLRGLGRLEVITLASIVEKEAVLPEERAIIASVFHNRLRRGMRLQSDPTAIYGIEGFHRAISPRDLRRNSPYNTYLHVGLPPGPICCPGRGAIEACLNPAQTPYLYFVSQGNGRHTFSTTLRQHNQAVSRLRKNKARHP